MFNLSLYYLLNIIFKHLASNEVDIGGRNVSKDPCDEARDECNLIHCPYGKEAYVDEHDCERCHCVDPCSNVICPEGTRCSITLGASAIEGTEYKGVCRSSELNNSRVYSTFLF